MHGTLSVAPAALEGANALTDTERLVELEPGRSPRHAGRSGTGRIGSVEVLAAVIAVFVPASFFTRALPRKPALAVPVASAAGVVLPGCECASVPIAGALVRRGITPAAALAFLLSSPAINPVVLASTAVAFPGKPEMVLARGVASILTATAMGWLWLRLGRAEWIRLPHRTHVDGMAKWPAFWASVRHDVAHAGGFLVLGSMAAATVNTVLPQRFLLQVGHTPVLSVL